MGVGWGRRGHILKEAERKPFQFHFSVLVAFKGIGFLLLLIIITGHNCVVHKWPLHGCSIICPEKIHVQ